jgi:hypothetical protein
VLQEGQLMANSKTKGGMVIHTEADKEQKGRKIFVGWRGENLIWRGKREAHRPDHIDHSFLFIGAWASPTFVCLLRCGTF